MSIIVRDVREKASKVYCCELPLDMLQVITISSHKVINNNNNVEIIGSIGTISKSFRKYVTNIPGNHEVKELQKTAILDTVHILRKVLM